jgi:predicted metal-dependent hydrolase
MNRKENQVKIDKIIRSKRKTIAIYITKDSELIVRANYRSPLSDIRRFVIDQSDWIIKKKELAYKNSLLANVVSENHNNFVLYLGRYYPLTIINGSSPLIEFDGKGFNLNINSGSSKRDILISWYFHRAHRIIYDKVLYYSINYNFRFKKFRISSAEKRWGSCSASGNLNFSWRLIMAPDDIIEYVVVHELAHLEELNHSERFWNKVEAILPDYKIRRKWLNQNSHLFHI